MESGVCRKGSSEIGVTNKKTCNKVFWGYGIQGPGKTPGQHSAGSVPFVHPPSMMRLSLNLPLSSIHIHPSFHCSQPAMSTFALSYAQHKTGFGPKAHWLSAEIMKSLVQRKKNPLHGVYPISVSSVQFPPSGAYDLGLNHVPPL